MNQLLTGTLFVAVVGGIICVFERASEARAERSERKGRERGAHEPIDVGPVNIEHDSKKLR